jgi:hypothetical protein
VDGLGVTSGTLPLFGLPATTDPALKLGRFFEVTLAYYSAWMMSTEKAAIQEYYFVSEVTVAGGN